MVGKQPINGGFLFFTWSENGQILIYITIGYSFILSGRYSIMAKVNWEKAKQEYITKSSLSDRIGINDKGTKSYGQQRA